MNKTARKWVSIWLMVGCAMVFFQVIVGGVTRLTESGLSITEWKPVKGIVPPLSQAEWQQEFDLYQRITQFKTLNQSMTLDEFKWIYFWEYFHRFWARFMGFVFILPFAFFVYKKWFDAALQKKIGVLFLWGGAIGIYGWIMVPIHLSIHLVLALSLFGYLVYMTLSVANTNAEKAPLRTHDVSVALKLAYALLTLLFMQIFIGGIVSGMKAGLAANTWPSINGEFIPATLWQLSPSADAFTTYNAQDFWGRIFIQFVHRSTAYGLVVLVVYFVYKTKKLNLSSAFSWSRDLLPLTVLVQAVIGIVTVTNCVGHIPVFYGVMHQAGAMLLIANMVWVVFALRKY
jgi:heme a synthase